ncbi:kynurenine aminotransferase-like [Phymastichus coffea]|uniref:kynurenine aminotransferase-like n=1 Tax=Phymastichus coffea TaxID=108790 RepID=UPI00273B794B|nr:kynurenine aminotransferase-like [Phymastichus coffea]
MRPFPVSLAILIHLPIVIGTLSSKRLTSNFNKNDPVLLLEFQDLKAKHNPLSFGMGYPDFNPPKILQKALARAAVSDDYELNQYASSRGHPRLLKAVAAFFSKLLNRTLNPDENVVIAVGAQEAIHGILQAHTTTGDEWIVFSPYFSYFDPIIKAAYGVPKYIPLVSSKTTGNITSSDFKFDKKDLASLFNHKTKGILVNTPHNPTGKVFDYEELAYIANLAKKWDSIVILDEVYQFLNYGNQQHLRLATFPGMFERTITVGSGGKMFSATGYRIGWAYGPKDLINNVKLVNGFAVMSAPTPIQEAVAVAIEEEDDNYGKPESYIEQLRRESEKKRNFMYKILSDAGMTPVFAESGYFIIARWNTMVNTFQLHRKSDEPADYSFVRWLIKNVSVFANPLSRFYTSDIDSHVEEHYIRFTMIKKWETLGQLDRLLKKWKSRRSLKQ